MSEASGRRSLFWTIAGMFLLTAVLGTAVQALVAVAVLRPLEVREARARAELVVSSVASELAAMPRMPAGDALDSLLDIQRDHAGFRPGLVVFRGADGTLAAAPPGAARLVMNDSSIVVGLIPREQVPPTPPVTRVDTTRREFRGTSRGRLELIARHTVTRGATRVGEVQALRRTPPPGIPGFPDARALWMFLPIAIAVSIIAGLVVVRLLVARLRAMEVLAARVAEGDLSVRIADTSGDEIGRLAERLDRMTARLADARDQLAANDRQRRQLFADITHELATPLTSIRGYAETMLDPRVTVSNDERARYVRGVVDESQRMDRLIRDLFELARLEAHAVPFVVEPLDWAALVRNTAERFQPRFEKAGLRLVVERTPNEAWVEADGNRLEQVIENLLVNALRYVPKGGTVELALDEAPGGRFRLSVSDDGPGLPAHELSLVFDRFFRGTRPEGAGQDGGSGLGLAIVREIVERHDGVVRAEARAPHGLTVWVELRASTAR